MGPHTAYMDKYVCGPTWRRDTTNYVQNFDMIEMCISVLSRSCEEYGPPVKPEAQRARIQSDMKNMY